MSRTQDLVRRVAAVADGLHRVVVALTAMGVAAALAAGTGAAASDRFSSKGLVAGVIVIALFVTPPWLLGRFAVDVGRIRRLPEITADQVGAAASRLGGRLDEGRRHATGDAGRAVKAWRLLQVGRRLRADLDELAEGGLAPAASLVQALVPTRLLAVSLAGLATPVLLAIGLVVLAIGLAVG